MSEALLKTFRRRPQGSREQEQIYNRAMRKIASARGMNKKPDSSLLTIAKEYKPETQAQLKRKQSIAANMGLTLVGGPLVKGAVKGVQLGRAALAGLPKGITKVRGGFKVGDKTYKTLGGAKGAVTKAGKKPPPPPKTPPANVKPNIDKAAPSVRAAGRPNRTQKALQRGEREADKLKKAAGSGRKPPGKLKAAAVPVATGLAAIAATTGSKPKPKPKSNIADVGKKSAPPKAKAKPAPTKPARKKPARKKPVRSGTGRGNMAGKNMGSESISEYVGDMQGRKTKVRLPFGMGSVDVDSTDEGMAFEEFDQKYGGKVMTRKKGGKAKPRRRAALRGHRAEQRGG